jgi:hypothetical protein
MQKTEDNNTLPFKCSSPLKDDDGLLVDFFDLLLQWDLEDEKNKKQDKQKIQTQI